MKKWIALLLALVMMLSLVACEAVNKFTWEVAPFVGEWTGDVDMTMLVDALMTEMTGLDMVFEDLILNIRFVFHEDGSCEQILAEEDAAAFMDKFIDGYANSLIAAGAVGTKEEIRAAIESELDMDALIEDLMSSFDSNYYLYKDHRIYLSSEKNVLTADYEKNAECIWVIELDGSTMTVQDMIDLNGVSVKDENLGLVPIVLNKLKG